MSEAGHVRIHRSLIGHPAFRNDAEAMAFAWMVIRAQWKPTRVRYKERGIVLARGQLAVSVRDMASALDRDKAWVERLWKRLKSETMIETATDAGVSVVTICNYNEYQGSRDTSRTARETPAETDARQGQDTEQGREEGKKEDVANATSAPKARGMRIPANFQPAPVPQPVADLLALWPPGREERELDGFRDYWLARTKDAARLDWNKTWHNRIRDQHDRIMRENRSGAGHWQRDREIAAQHPGGVSGLAWDDAFEALGVGRTGTASGETRRGSPDGDTCGYPLRAVEARRLNG